MDQPSTGTFSRKPLIGREATVAHVVAQMEQHRCFTVVGVGGIGKTSVAREAAHRIGGSLDDGMCFVDLSILSDPGLLAAAVGSALATGLDMTAAEDPDFDTLRAFLNDKRLLLVLDNCEHLVEESAHLVEALLSAPDVRVLATSREPLRARGEVVHRIAPLSCPEDLQAPQAAQALRYGAVELFVERAGLALGWDGADAQLIDGVCRLCRRLDGMPLAIELAAAQVRVVGVQEVLSRLGADLLTLADPDGSPLARHRTMQATLDWSHSLLTREEQVVLRRLAVFRGAFSLESGARVAADGKITEDQAGLALMSLASKSMLAADASSGVPLPRLLETTRDYATARLAAAGERAQARERHAQECGAILAQAERKWQGSAPSAWVAAHRSMADDVRAGIDWALGEGNDPRLGARLVLAAVPLAGRLSLQREFVGRLRKALERLKTADADGPTQLEFQLTSALAELLTFSYGHALAAPVYERLGELAGHTGSPEDRFAAMVGAWANSHFLGNYVAMQRAAEQLQARVQDNREPSEELFAHRAMAYALHYRGDHASASAWAQRALAHPLGQYPASYLLQTMIDREVGMRMILARTLWISGHPDQAVEVAQECIRRAEGDRPAALCAALSIAACPIALWRGDAEPARAMVERIRSHATLHGMAFWLSWATHYEQVLGLREAAARGADVLAVPHPRGRDAVEKDMIATLDDSGLEETTLARAEQDIAGWCAPEVLRVQALALLRVDPAAGSARGQALLERSLALAGFQGALSWELRSATSLAQLHARQGRAGLAQAVLESVHGRFREGLATRDVAIAGALLEEIARSQ